MLGININIILFWVCVCVWVKVFGCNRVHGVLVLNISAGPRQFCEGAHEEGVRRDVCFRRRSGNQPFLVAIPLCSLKILCVHACNCKRFEPSSNLSHLQICSLSQIMSHAFRVRNICGQVRKKRGGLVLGISNNEIFSQLFQ